MISILGGGLIGLSTAFELVSRGHSVRLYDPAPWDSANRASCSWAGAGMLAPDNESFPDALWRSRAREAALSYPKWIERLASPIDFLPPRLVGDQIRDGHVDPRDLLHALRRHLIGELSGGLPGSLPGHFEYRPQRVDQISSLVDHDLVVTSGSWSNQLGPLPEVFPVKGYLHSWDHLPPGSLREVLHDGPTYVFQRLRGPVVAGSTEEESGFDANVGWAHLRDLRRRAERLFPPLSAQPPSQSWWGFRPATRSGVPVLESRPYHGRKLVLAYGPYRNGILLADWTARWVADQFS